MLYYSYQNRSASFSRSGLRQTSSGAMSLIPKPSSKFAGKTQAARLYGVLPPSDGLVYELIWLAISAISLAVSTSKSVCLFGTIFLISTWFFSADPF